MLAQPRPHVFALSILCACGSKPPAADEPGGSETTSGTASSESSEGSTAAGPSDGPGDGSSDASSGDASTTDAESSGEPSTWFGEPRASARVFVSGHSLLDHVAGPEEFDGGPLAIIAATAGLDHGSQLQSAPGSTARARRDDILEGRYATPTWADFDTLVVAERHDLARTLVYESTLDAVGWFVDAIEGDELYVYQTWYDFHAPDPWGSPDLATWDQWEQYHRDELVVHKCTAERIGRARNRTIRVLPAALALAELSLAIRSGDVPGLRDPSELFVDTVHLGELGHVYLGLVAFSTIYRTPSSGLEVPGVDPATLQAFARLADETVAAHFDGYVSPSAAECRDALETICGQWDMNCAMQAPMLFGDDDW